MSGLRIETVTKTFCSECGRELKDERDWSACRSQHTLEYHARTPEGRTMLEMLNGMLSERRPNPIAGEGRE